MKKTSLSGSLVIIGAGLLLGALMGFSYNFLHDAGYDLFSGLLAPFQASNVPVLNRLAPDFELKDLSGTSVRLSSLKGKPVLINFWATWCGPCQSEMPLIQEIAQKYPNLVVLAVNDGEVQRDVVDFVDRYGLKFPVLMDPEALVNIQYQVTGLPTSYFVDEQGVIRSLQIGVLSDTQIETHLKKIGVR